jgi:hypothetical protein
MILFSFHINENLAFDAFQEEGWQTTLKGWEVSLQDFFSDPSVLHEYPALRTT